MKWRSVKPKPWEFLWRTSVRGPFQPMPTPSLPGRVAIGGRGLSLAEERPSLRPLACKHREAEIQLQVLSPAADAAFPEILKDEMSTVLATALCEINCLISVLSHYLHQQERNTAVFQIYGLWVK